MFLPGIGLLGRGNCEEGPGWGRMGRGWEWKKKKYLKDSAGRKREKKSTWGEYLRFNREMLGLGIIDGEYELINALGPSQENCVMRDCDICYLFQQYIILDSVKKFQSFKLLIYVILVILMQDSGGWDEEIDTKTASVNVCLCECGHVGVYMHVCAAFKDIKKDSLPANSSSVCGTKIYLFPCYHSQRRAWLHCQVNLSIKGYLDPIPMWWVPSTPTNNSILMLSAQR